MSERRPLAHLSNLQDHSGRLFLYLYLLMVLSQLPAYTHSAAHDSLVVPLSNNPSKKISLEFYGKDKEGNEMAEAQLIDRGQIISRLGVDPVGVPDQGYEISGKDLGDKGLSGHLRIISFMFSKPACDYANGEILLILKDNKLIYGTTATGASTDYAVDSYRYLFPKDKGGQPDRLIINHSLARIVMHGNLGEPDEKHAERSKEVYRWNGSKLSKIR